MKNKLLAVLVALATAVVLPVTRAADVDADASQYQKLANGIIAQAVLGKIDVASVRADTAKMLDLAVSFAGQYKAKFPAGAKLMDLMISKKDSLATMSLEAIDAEFEAAAINKAHGAALGLDLTAEENEHFGNPVDCFVHPATVAICAKLWEQDHKQEHLTRLQSELQEVVEHCRHTVEKLKK
jgi:hypothetical protein